MREIIKKIKACLKNSELGNFIIKIILIIKRLQNQLVGNELWIRKQINKKQEFHGNFHNGFAIHPEGIHSGSIVYSFGVGKDISFDLSLIEKYNLEVYAFDPTPTSVEWTEKQLPLRNFSFFNFGIADYDGTAKFFRHRNSRAISLTMLDVDSSEYFEVKVFRLKTIMEKLGHPSIDILKMDIEGAEYKVLRDIIHTNLQINQLVLEFHHAYKGFNIDKKETLHACNLLNNHNYRIFAISASGTEYSFIRR